MSKGIHIFFSGMVQGVGFRFTARVLAQGHKIVGWVKNLPDGRVEILAEGDKKNLDMFLNSLKEEFNRYIADCQFQDSPYSGEFKDFRIKF